MDQTKLAIDTLEKRGQRNTNRKNSPAYHRLSAVRVSFLELSNLNGDLRAENRMRQRLGRSWPAVDSEDRL